MKRILMFSLLVCSMLPLAAQTVSRSGAYYDGEETAIRRAETVVGVTVEIEKRTFTPGIYARYAQKYLGVRASLAERTETAIVAASLSLLPSKEYGAERRFEGTGEAAIQTLPLNRVDNGASTAEEQASATAAMIFSLRKHRMDLITGETGENVFGAGLSAALAEIERLEKAYLAMFYGEETVETVSESFQVIPVPGEKNYILCRYRDGAGLLPVSDLSGEAVVLHIEPSGKTDLGGLVPAGEKERNRVEVVVADMSACTLLCGARELVSATLPILQYGTRVDVAVAAR